MFKLLLQMRMTYTIVLDLLVFYKNIKLLYLLDNLNIKFVTLKSHLVFIYILTMQ